MRAAVLRLAVFGLAPAVRFDAVANRFAYLASIHRPLTVYGGGQQVRPQLHVSDASSAIRFALAHPAEAAGGLYNVVGEHVSVQGLVDMIRALRPEVDVRYTERILTHLVRGGREPVQRIGLVPLVGLDAGLAELMNRLRAFSVPARGRGAFDSRLNAVSRQPSVFALLPPCPLSTRWKDEVQHGTQPQGRVCTPAPARWAIL
jgi:nucleoside-diphosphate-sugar epimerase